jgi:signal transduction histidine kinase
MFRFSTKGMMVLAAFCFAGLVGMQVAWMQSAYRGEVALMDKAKKQFELELRGEIISDSTIQRHLVSLADSYEKNQLPTRKNADWFFMNLVPGIEMKPENASRGIFLEGISLVSKTGMDRTHKRLATIITNRYDNPPEYMLQSAGMICISCITQANTSRAADSSYQLVLFYRDDHEVIFEKLGLLMIGAMVFLVVYGLLFWQLMRKFKQEKKLSEAKNDFINNLSHEMQTPVFAIQMANRLIKDKAMSLPEIKPLTLIIEKESKQLKLHAGKILELASLESGQVELSLELTELNTFLEERRETLVLMVHAKNGTLMMKSDTGSLYAAIDRVHLNNVLVTLVDNAIKYNDGQPKITIETGTDKGFVSFAIHDNGIGIKAGFLPYVTNKFFRVPGVKRTGIPGFGLGLHYARQIIELHGGRMNIASKEGIGTTVTILLPKAPGDV